MGELLHTGLEEGSSGHLGHLMGMWLNGPTFPPSTQQVRVRVCYFVVARQLLRCLVTWGT